MHMHSKLLFEQIVTRRSSSLRWLILHTFLTTSPHVFCLAVIALWTQCAANASCHTRMSFCARRTYFTFRKPFDVRVCSMVNTRYATYFTFFVHVLSNWTQLTTCLRFIQVVHSRCAICTPWTLDTILCTWTKGTCTGKRWSSYATWTIWTKFTFSLAWR